MSAREFLLSACLRYDGGDGPERRAEAARLLATSPELADDFLVACARGDVARVDAALQQDRGLVERTDPLGWSSPMVVTYGRVLAPSADSVAVLRLLLDAGADPDAHVKWGGTYHFSALTGAWGEGEGGPRAQPEHPQAAALSALLLERGADPNDGQALYNRMFTPGSACLKALLAAGLHRDHTLNWPGPDGAPQTRTTLGYQLHSACGRGDRERVELLLAADARLDEADNGVTPWRAAYLNGHRAIAERLVQAGAEAEPVDPIDEFVANLRGGRLQEAHAHAALRSAAEERYGDLLGDVVARGNVDAIDFLVGLGVDVNGTPHTPATHQAAYHGRGAALLRLLELGADPMIRDERFGATALGWAQHAGQQEMVALLTPHVDEE